MQAVVVHAELTAAAAAVTVPVVGAAVVLDSRVAGTLSRSVNSAFRTEVVEPPVQNPSRAQVC